MSYRNNKKKIMFFGILIIVLSFILTPSFFESNFSPDGQLDFEWKARYIVGFDILLLIIGVTIFFRPDFLYFRWKEILLFLVVLLSVLVLLELTILFLFDNPHLMVYVPEPVRVFFRWPYASILEVVQFKESCAIYDEGLTYTLRPGKCIFSNLEFSNELYINSVGLRDDESSLESPEIIVLGDSYAMGWGVEQDETFAQQLEFLTGKKVLNAAVSSYGTVREKMMLDRLDLSNVEYIILQYCSNDYSENEYFYSFGELKILSSERYNELIKEHADRRKYFFGEYLYTSIAKGLESHYDSGAKPNLEAEALFFSHALLNAGETNWEDLKVIVVNFDSRIAPYLNAEIENGTYSSFFDNVELLDLSYDFTSEHVFNFDFHLNKEGHKFLANKLQDIIQNEDN